jgi:hypothetical protein
MDPFPNATRQVNLTSSRRALGHALTTLLAGAAAIVTVWEEVLLVGGIYANATDKRGADPLTILVGFGLFMIPPLTAVLSFRWGRARGRTGAEVTRLVSLCLLIMSVVVFVAALLAIPLG